MKRKGIGQKDGIKRVIVGRIAPPHMDFRSVKKAMTPRSFEFSLRINKDVELQIVTLV